MIYSFNEWACACACVWCVKLNRRGDFLHLPGIHNCPRAPLDARHHAGHRGEGQWGRDTNDEVFRTPKGPFSHHPPPGGGTHLSLSSPQMNQFSSDPTCFFASPTLNPVTRDLKEVDPGVFPFPACSAAGPAPPGRLRSPRRGRSGAPTAPTHPAPRLRKAPTRSGLGAAPLPGTRGRCRPTAVAMVTAGGGVGFT